MRSLAILPHPGDRVSSHGRLCVLAQDDPALDTTAWSPNLGYQRMQVMG